MAAHSLALSAPIVSVSHGQATTTSKAVADYFHKQHKNVLQKIDALLPDLPQEWRELNFQPTFCEVPGPNGAIRREPCYEITRNGFTLLAMGFTGKQALQWKLRYIEAFNAMESRLHGEGSLPFGHVAISKDRLEQLRLYLLDWKACSNRLYGPLRALGAPEGATLYTYAHELALVWGMATGTWLSNGQVLSSTAIPSFDSRTVIAPRRT